ncbi:hypothetical protein FEA48_03670 [Pseudomonas nitroreducens]|uniref:Tetratricopeptide repeat protein n=1 Tax=Pseudomonas nitroreducens TaxID=46680 RepID=A0A5R9AIC3_PSENT|nr:TssQ family T6SS-associated lipoprotein [Pseudomonas nitroreducens]TLP78308.1 hypothetical protein FEA48_03670 [Pseudomonas nitroreducens]
MKSPRPLSTPLLIACLAIVASGCKHHFAEAPADADQAQAQQAFDEATRSYEAGDYAAAEEQFLTPKLWSVDSPLQVQALKYLAFSYCVTERPNQCRFAFERAVQINPSFRLERAEAGHPLWGPVFEEVVGR